MSVRGRVAPSRIRGTVLAYLALTKPRVREAIEKMAAEPAGGTPAEFGQFLNAQLAHWSRVVKESGIKMHQ